MREIEIKARIKDQNETEKCLEHLFGKGKKVKKTDHYFRLPGETIQSVRVREVDDFITITTKGERNAGLFEDNGEYEFRASISELTSALNFFEKLGHERYFIKHKEGYEWYCGKTHIELLSVNDLGCFLEMEIILSDDATPDEKKEAEEEIRNIMDKLGISESNVEKRSYREMILGKEEKIVTIYTDGSCLGNPGPGGWAAILLIDGKEKVISGGEGETTNNRMELTSAIEALSLLGEKSRVVLYSDSKYLTDSFLKGWVYSWEEKGFKKGKEDVPNTDLWKKLLRLVRSHDVTFRWIKGHSYNEINNKCDALAVKESEKFISKES